MPKLTRRLFRMTDKCMLQPTEFAARKQKKSEIQKQYVQYYVTILLCSFLWLLN